MTSRNAEDDCYEARLAQLKRGDCARTLASADLVGAKITKYAYRSRVDFRPTIYVD